MLGWMQGYYGDGDGDGDEDLQGRMRMLRVGC